MTEQITSTLSPVASTLLISALSAIASSSERFSFNGSSKPEDEEKGKKLDFIAFIISAATPEQRERAEAEIAAMNETERLQRFGRASILGANGNLATQMLGIETSDAIELFIPSHGDYPWSTKFDSSEAEATAFIEFVRKFVTNNYGVTLPEFVVTTIQSETVA